MYIIQYDKSYFLANSEEYAITIALDLYQQKLLLRLKRDIAYKFINANEMKLYNNFLDKINNNFEFTIKDDIFRHNQIYIYQKPIDEPFREINKELQDLVHKQNKLQTFK